MSHIPDDKLFTYGSRVQGKVLVLTGGANGIGKETALRFASHGAKVVIGDLDTTGAAKVVAEIESAGGTATSLRCNVTDWDDQVKLFDLAMKKYGNVDIVIPNAGVSEIGSFETLIFKDGKPQKPNMKTLDINLIGVLYTAHLAVHYLQVDHQPGSLKALIFIGSIASWLAIPTGEMYSGSKHAVLGVMRSLHVPMELKGIRVGCIHPFFADTAIVPLPMKLFLAGIPLTTVQRIAGAFFYAATDVDMNTSGCAWLLADDGPVFMVPREEFKMGVYKMIDDRINAGKVALKGVKLFTAVVRDVYRITKPAIKFGLAVAAAGLAYSNRTAVEETIRSFTS